MPTWSDEANLFNYYAQEAPIISRTLNLHKTLQTPNWSRADLAIPVAHHTDVDNALEVIDTVAQEMSCEQLWKEQIVDKPEVLGVDDFGSRGVIIRVWIKTQPLKQWNVAREFRRRLKVALDQAGISIPMPQQEVWFNGAVPVNSSLDGSSSPR